MTSASKEIDDIIQKMGDWRGQTLAKLRSVINDATSDLTEEVKWKKPSKPEGIPVWVHEGNVCMADTLKNAVRLTFPKGAQLHDPKKLFNTRLDSKTVRAVDCYEDATVDEGALQALIVEAAKLNATK
ncbi:MAG: hypothetical protein JWN38_171 [Candidatus Saccharibacteria bacterium]|nr:hypothetical protein [Candidatus Saccharibacteria bacterium]